MLSDDIAINLLNLFIKKNIPIITIFFNKENKILIY